MLPTLLLTSLAFGGPAQVVAIGDGLVAAAPLVEDAEAVAPSEADQAPVVVATELTPLPGGWISVLADCLDEGAPSQWVVVDQSAEGETAKSALGRVDEVQALSPSVVLVGVGARELANPEATVETFQTDVAALLGALRPPEGVQNPEVFLVGMVPPTLSQTQEPADQQQAADSRIEAWNAVLARIAQDDIALHHVDLWKEWPREADDRGLLTVDGWRLSHQGHARVAAAVCDRVLGWTRARN